MSYTALLVLEDGSTFKGTSIGAQGCQVGEVVFNTSMTGYQEILTDPSYCKQLVTLTYPHIGNTGITREDEESTQVHAQGLIVRDLPATYSNFRASQSLSDYLKAHQIVAISDIDTRKLTRILRQTGAQAGCLMALDPQLTLDEQVAHALAQARAFAGLNGMDLAKAVSVTETYEWSEGSWQLGQGHAAPSRDTLPYHVVAYDFGIKRNILRLLVDQGCRVTVVPAQTPASEVLALQPDGVFLSNGPGDPAPCTYAIAAIKTLLAARMPLFGICLGHQLLALALGAKTEKMKFGHHGANHPVKRLHNNTVMITAQNHGFAVDAATLPAGVQATHVSLFDGSLQGISCTNAPAFSFQGHPEASPGPHDCSELFAQFIELIKRHRA
ncbi:MAG: glutamine-hydrolyzing carbamoyl-phosphate synthase small subunit [Aeromonas sp.]